MTFVELILRCGWPFYALVLGGFCTVMRSGGTDGLVNAIQARELRRSHAAARDDIYTSPISCAEVAAASSQALALVVCLRRAARLLASGLGAWLAAGLARTATIEAASFACAVVALVAPIAALIVVVPFVQYVWKSGWPSTGSS